MKQSDESQPRSPEGYFQGYRSLLTAKNTYRVVYRIVRDDLIEVAYIRYYSRQLRLRVIREKK